MRKVLSMLLCVALLCSMVVISVQADGGAALSVANAVAIPGSTVVLDININDNPGLTAVKLRVTDVDGLGATYEGATTITTSKWAFTPNDEGGVYVWYGPTAITTVNFGTLAITIPDEAEAGVYHFTLASGTGDDQAVNGAIPVDIATAEFTITVAEKVITGVNVAIDSGLAIGVHVQAADIEGVSITALDLAGKEFKTIEDYEEDEEAGDYVFYVNVNPWAMDVDFTIDFTDNFVIDGEGDDAVLDTEQLPETAKTIGILSYCEALLAGGPSNKLKQLIADMLAFGQEAQAYQGVTVMALPEGLTPTVGEWLDGEENPTDFGTFCSENFPEDLTAKNSTSKKKFKFDQAEIKFGSKFVVVFTMANNGTETANSLARLKVDGTTYTLDGWDFTYAFTPAQYAGVEFDLYATSTTATNFCWINNYGPAHYAAYLNENGGTEAMLALLEAYYLYGVSAEAYVGSLGE